MKRKFQQDVASAADALTGFRIYATAYRSDLKEAIFVGEVRVAEAENKAFYAGFRAGRARRHYAAVHHAALERTVSVDSSFYQWALGERVESSLNYVLVLLEGAVRASRSAKVGASSFSEETVKNVAAATIHHLASDHDRVIRYLAVHGLFSVHQDTVRYLGLSDQAPDFTGEMA